MGASTRMAIIAANATMFSTSGDEKNNSRSYKAIPKIKFRQKQTN